MKVSELITQTSNVSTSPSAALVLGNARNGDLTDWVQGASFCFPERALAQHAVIVGQSGVGKTETVLRLAYGAAKVYGYQVICIDAKGDPVTAARFSIAMAQAGVERIALFPVQPYNGWRGDPSALFNRLLAIESFTEPYYKNMAKLLLHLAIHSPHGTPQSSRELLASLRLDGLQQAYIGRPEGADLATLRPVDAFGVYHRYRAFFAALHGKLDGGWSFEDVDACYLLLDGLALKEEATSLGAFLVEDFCHYVARRKEAQRKVLFIIDEFSALALGTDAANLFERIRSFGGAVIVTSQSYAGLGYDAERILGAATTIILHQTGNPEDLINRAGTRRHIERSTQLDEGGVTGKGSARTQDTFRVSPNAVRQLGVGEVYVIAHGRAHQVGVERLSLPEDLCTQMLTAIRTEMAKLPHASPAAPPSPPSGIAF